ncbi:cereblon family protein [Magnetococcales bacterium HHB-1]
MKNRHDNMHFSLFFKIEQPTPPISKLDLQNQSKDDLKKERKKRKIFCKSCRNTITDHKHKINVLGSHTHTFKNPSQIYFNVGCFQKAGGCLVLGTPIAEYSWFKSYRWQMAHCQQCNQHLGWFFSSNAEQTFFALIRDLLLDPR